MYPCKFISDEILNIKSEMDFVGKRITNGHYRLLKLRIALVELIITYNKYILLKTK